MSPYDFNFQTSSDSFAGRHLRPTPFFPISRQFLLEEVVFAELENLLISHAGMSDYMLAPSNKFQPVDLSNVKFNIPGISVLMASPGMLVVTTRETRNQERIKEEVALTFANACLEEAWTRESLQDAYEVWQKGKDQEAEETTLENYGDYLAAYSAE